MVRLSDHLPGDFCRDTELFWAGPADRVLGPTRELPSTARSASGKVDGYGLPPCLSESPAHWVHQTSVEYAGMNAPGPTSHTPLNKCAQESITSRPALNYESGRGVGAAGWMADGARTARVRHLGFSPGHGRGGNRRPSSEWPSRRAGTPRRACPGLPSLAGLQGEGRGGNRWPSGEWPSRRAGTPRMACPGEIQRPQRPSRVGVSRFTEQLFRRNSELFFGKKPFSNRHRKPG